MSRGGRKRIGYTIKVKKNRGRTNRLNVALLVEKIKVFSSDNGSKGSERSKIEVECVHQKGADKYLFDSFFSFERR